MHKKSKDRKSWLFSKMEHLYNCKNKLKVNIDGKCVDYKNKKAQATRV